MASWQQYYDNHKKRFGQIHAMFIDDAIDKNFGRNLTRDPLDRDAKALVLAERIVEVSTNFQQVNERLSLLKASVNLSEGRFIDFLNSPEKLFSREEQGWVFKDIDIPYPNGPKKTRYLLRRLLWRGMSSLGNVVNEAEIELPKEEEEPEVALAPEEEFDPVRIEPGSLVRKDLREITAEYQLELE